MQTIEEYLDYVLNDNCTSLHIKANRCSYARKMGRIFQIDDRIFSDQEVIDFNNKYSKDKIGESIHKETIDFSIEYKDARFRVNTYHDRNGYCLALRLIKLFSTDFSVLRIPEKLKDLVTKQSGLILITGPTGSGKSTTLAALVNYINNVKNAHIISVEDPIEYTFDANECLITQREIGIDATSFEQSVIDAIREDPDVMVIGEMRDRESIEATLMAAETGHLVLSTLHTKNATSTINRIIDMFPPDKHGQILDQLSNSLICVLSQQLLPAKDNSRLYLATEFLINNNAISSNIKQNKTQMLANILELGSRDSMYLMNKSIDELVKKGVVDSKIAEMYRQ